MTNGLDGKKTTFYKIEIENIIAYTNQPVFG